MKSSVKSRLECLFLGQLKPAPRKPGFKRPGRHDSRTGSTFWGQEAHAAGGIVAW